MPETIVTRILRLSGYGVYQHVCDEVAQTVTCGVRPEAAKPYACCPGCGISTRATVGSPTERRVRDLPWSPWQVWLVVEIQTVACRRGGRHRERIPVLALRWQRLPAFATLAQLLLTHLAGILASCHGTVPFGVVEAINGNIRAMLRRGRGYRDHAYLLLKVQRATADSRRLRAA